MAMIALQGVYGTPVAVAMAASAGCKQFLVPAKLSVRVRHLSPRRRASVVSAKHIGSYLNPTVMDKEKEEAMEYRRMVFDHEDWIRHRSSSRHGRHLASIVSSRVIMALGPPVFSLTAFAAVVTFYNEALSGKMLPAWLPLLHISSLPFSLTAPALALLLVFRTNASYGRFDEARKAWGMNVNRCRDVCRQALSFMRFPADASELQSFLHHAAALSYALKSQIMSEVVYSTSMSEMEKASMDRNLTQFHDNVGTCERIFKTPIPLSYTRLTSRFLVIWHIALPLGLWDECRWLTIPAVFFNAAALLCIEEVGVLIEEPFSTLALGSICNAIKNSIATLVEAHTEYAQKANRRSNFEAKL